MFYAYVEIIISPDHQMGLNWKYLGYIQSKENQLSFTILLGCRMNFKLLLH